MLQPKIQRSVRKTECGFCIIFILKGIMPFQSERVHMFYWTNIKTKRNWEWKIPHTIFERGTLCFSSYNNRQLQLKLFAKEKRGPSLYHLFCPKELFFYTCVSFFYLYLNVWCIEYFFRMYILLHIKKYYFIHLCCLFLNSSKAFSVSLILRIPKLFGREACGFLNNCFWMFINKLFTYLTCAYLKK